MPITTLKIRLPLIARCTRYNIVFIRVCYWYILFKYGSYVARRYIQTFQHTRLCHYILFVDNILHCNEFFSCLCNQCLSPLMLWVRTLLMRGVLDTILFDQVCQWLATGQWFFPGTPVSSTNKTDRHDMTEILLKVVLNTINQINYSQTFPCCHLY